MTRAEIEALAQKLGELSWFLASGLFSKRFVSYVDSMPTKDEQMYGLFREIIAQDPYQLYLGDIEQYKLRPNEIAQVMLTGLAVDSGCQQMIAGLDEGLTEVVTASLWLDVWLSQKQLIGREQLLQAKSRVSDLWDVQIRRYVRLSLDLLDVEERAQFPAFVNSMLEVVQKAIDVNSLDKIIQDCRDDDSYRDQVRRKFLDSLQHVGNFCVKVSDAYQRVNMGVDEYIIEVCEEILIMAYTLFHRIAESMASLSLGEEISAMIIKSGYDLAIRSKDEPIFMMHQSFPYYMECVASLLNQGDISDLDKCWLEFWVMSLEPHSFPHVYLIGIYEGLTQIGGMVKSSRDGEETIVLDKSMVSNALSKIDGYKDSLRRYRRHLPGDDQERRVLGAVISDMRSRLSACEQALTELSSQ